VGALSNPEVGEYLNEHFVSAQGGNVVSYFALPNGTVLHAVAGPVDGAELLREARWVIETRKMGMARSRGNMTRYKSFWGQAHAERLQTEHTISLGLRSPSNITSLRSPGAATRQLLRPNLNLQGQIHWLLAIRPLVKLDQISNLVFEQILGQKVSALPVQVN
jgi:hypothetical protein